uniref:Uncharacterized protein n=1 Tax=Nelumbo nucifera TaxID=4432 RepID=A0A822Y1P9_NELNU|nr:TPA_asm: hypothetical protein HUJ06_025041 [Nelumbo nucifera]
MKIIEITAAATLFFHCVLRKEGSEWSKWMTLVDSIGELRGEEKEVRGIKSGRRRLKMGKVGAAAPLLGLNGEDDE